MVLVLTDLQEDEGIREQSVRCAEELLAQSDTQNTAGYLIFDTKLLIMWLFSIVAKAFISF